MKNNGTHDDVNDAFIIVIFMQSLLLYINT